MSLTLSSDADVYRRRIRWAAFAGFLWAVFQLVATRRISVDYWAGSLAINALPVVLLAWGTLRGSLLTAVGLGVYGLYRLVMALRMIAALSDSAFARPVDWWVAPLAVPFAVLWIIGSVAAYRLWRRKVTGAGPPSRLPGAA